MGRPKLSNPRVLTGGMGGGGKIHFEAQVDWSKVRSAISSFQRKTRSMKVPLKEAAIDYMSREVIQERFDQQGKPKWKKLSPVTIARHGPHNILHLTGRLMRSATANSGDFFISYHTNYAVFGSSLEYAPIHDRPRGTFIEGVGGVQIPGRPWSFVTQKNANHMRDIMVNWVENKLKESGFYR